MHSSFHFLFGQFGETVCFSFIFFIFFSFSILNCFWRTFVFFFSILFCSHEGNRLPSNTWVFSNVSLFLALFSNGFCLPFFFFLLHSNGKVKLNLPSPFFGKETDAKPFNDFPPSPNRYLHSNQLEGQIPDFFQNLQNLESLFGSFPFPPFSKSRNNSLAISGGWMGIN